MSVEALDGRTVHPAAELFPMIEGDEFDKLVADIAEQGLLHPIALTPSGEILDGRNRLRACRKAGIEARFDVVNVEPWAYVISTNLRRRHLNDTQRAMIGGKIAERHRGGSGKIILNPSDEGFAHSRDVAPTATEAATLLNVGRSSIERARSVHRHGVPELVQATEEGKVPVYTAARVAVDLDEDQQREFAARVANGADPTKLASTLGSESPWSTRARNKEPAPVERKNQHSGRHRHIGARALQSLMDSLAAMEILLDNTPGGLDPSLTPTEVARLTSDLSKGRRVLTRVGKLLNQYKGE